jgi:WD40 repeat protein
LHRLRGHQNSVNCVAFSVEGALVAAGDTAGRAVVWNATSGEVLHEVDPGHGLIRAIAVNSDGTTLVTAHDDLSTCFHDLNTNTQVACIPVNPAPAALEFSHDGRMLLIGQGGNVGRIAVFDAETRGILRQVVSQRANAIFFPAFSHDDTLINGGGWGGQIGLWDVATGTDRFRSMDFGACNLSVAVSADCRQLASGGKDGNVVLWSLESGSRLRSIAIGGDPQSLAFNTQPKGLFVASRNGDGGLKKVGLWDVDTGEPRAVVRASGIHYSLPAAVMSPNGKLLASADETNAISVWEIEAGRERHILSGHTELVSAMAFSPGGQVLASAGRDGRIRLWDTQSGSEQRTLLTGKFHGTSLSFSQNGETLAGGLSDCTIRFWNTASGDEVKVLKGHNTNRFGVLDLAFSNDQHSLASCSGDGTVRLWDSDSGELLQTFAIGPPLGLIHDVAFTPDGRHLATANANGTVYLLRLRSK